MDDARQRTGEAGEGRDGLDAPIDRALDRMGGAGPIDVCAQVLARLDGAADAAGRWWAVWRPAAAVGGIALVVLLAPSRQGRRPRHARGIREGARERGRSFRRSSRGATGSGAVSARRARRLDRRTHPRDAAAASHPDSCDRAHADR